MTFLYLLIGALVACYFYNEYLKGKDKETVEEPTLIIGLATVTLVWPVYVFYKLVKRFLADKENKANKENEQQV